MLPKMLRYYGTSVRQDESKIDNGKVEALEKGTTVITVIAKKGDISSDAQCNITIEENPSV